MCTGISIYNEGSRFWKNLFALTRYGGFFEVFCYNLITGTKIIVRYTEDFAIRGSLCRGSTVKSLHSISTHLQPILVKLSSLLQIVTTGSKVRF